MVAICFKSMISPELGSRTRCILALRPLPCCQLPLAPVMVTWEEAAVSRGSSPWERGAVLRHFPRNINTILMHFLYSTCFQPFGNFFGPILGLFWSHIWACSSTDQKIQHAASPPRELESEATFGRSLLINFSPCCCVPPKKGAVVQSASPVPPRIPSLAFLSDNEEEVTPGNTWSQPGNSSWSQSGGELPTVELSFPSHSRMTQTPKFGLFQVPKVRGSLLTS